MVLLSLSLQPGNVVAWVFVGLIAGAIAGRIARGQGYGCLGDVVLGLIGSLVGGFVISLFVSGNKTAGFFQTTAVAIVGAVLFILGIRIIRKVL